MYRWNATTAGPPQANAIGPLVQRWGPGSGGVAGFSTIDPALKRPVMEEAVLGFEARPHPSAFVRLAAIGRRESNLIGVVDVGVPESTYSTIGVPDMGIDVVGAQDDQILLFYNRAPSTFGADRYLLTNPADDEATFVGAEMIGQVRANRLYFIAGVTAGRSEGLSANRGFSANRERRGGPRRGVHQSQRARPRAGTRLYRARLHDQDRDVVPVSARHDIRAHRALPGWAAFRTTGLLPGLNQGIEAVRAFRNGRTRFTFSMTVDARLQKGFGSAGHRLTAILDAYNLFNQALEVEEFSVTAPRRD
jgi:hypothetical protein